MDIIINILKKWGLEAAPEYKFHSTRRWRIDYAFPEVKLALEIEGGAWQCGRHNRPAGFIKDIEKYNALTELGWVLLRYQPNKIDYDQILKTYKMLQNRSKIE